MRQIGGCEQFIVSQYNSHRTKKRRGSSKLADHLITAKELTTESTNRLRTMNGTDLAAVVEAAAQASAERGTAVGLFKNIPFMTWYSPTYLCYFY